MAAILGANGMTMSEGIDQPAAVRLRQANVSFGRGQRITRAVQDVSFDVAPGEFVSVLGPSGCGKSTLIGVIAGLTPVETGNVSVDGWPVRRPGADRAVVFQHHALFPWKTVLGNVEFGLKMSGVGRRERRERARQLLCEVGLGDFLGHYPSQLSGGMQQRVSLARVLVNRPRVLLMDEPFSALDAQTRLQMQQMLLDLWQTYRMTVLFVTHDIDEALFLSDRVLIMCERPGRIKAELPISLPRPRTTDLLTYPEFVELKRQCLDWIKIDVPRPAHHAFSTGQEVFTFVTKDTEALAPCATPE